MQSFTLSQSIKTNLHIAENKTTPTKTQYNTFTLFYVNLCRKMYSTAPVDGHWGRWSSWGACSATCDNGTRVRTRKCDDPIPTNSGKPCPGDDKQQKACIIRRCSSGRYIFSIILLEDLKMDGDYFPGKISICFFQI